MIAETGLPIAASSFFPKTTGLYHCSRFITGYLKNLCTPDLPSLDLHVGAAMLTDVFCCVPAKDEVLF